MKGSVYKRCKCPVVYDDKGKRRNCRKDHGTWYYVADAGRDETGKRRQVKKGGFRTADEANDALAELVTRVGQGRYSHDEGLTVAQWLDRWLELKEREGLRASTLRAYRHHVRDYLVPQLGRYRLRDLRTGHVDRLVEAVQAGRSPATVRRIHATLSSALKTAARKNVIAYNVAKDATLPKAARLEARPWEPAELGQFLDSLGSHRLSGLFEVVAGTGLRRGEALGLRWDDVDLPARTLTVRRQVVQESGRLKNKQAAAPCPYCEAGHVGVSFGKPKTTAGEGRIVELDDGTVGALLAHQLRQQAEREAWGEAYADHGLVFCREDGNPLRPDDITKLFGDLVDAAGLRRVRLHDLRHGHASLMLAAGVDVAVVSKRLGHSTITITADTYSHLLPGVGREAADRASALIPRRRPTAADAPCDHDVTTSPMENAPADERETFAQVNEGDSGRPCGTRTHNQWIKSSARDMSRGDAS